jgi:hypothetical protein
LQSIAVLPFRDLTLSHDNDHIGLGLADAIITELAASRKLLVRPTSVIVAYRDRTVDPGAAAREQAARSGPRRSTAIDAFTAATASDPGFADTHRDAGCGRHHDADVVIRPGIC